MDSNKLAHRYLLVPDIAKFKERAEEKGVEVGSDPVWSYITNASEWMAVPKHYFDFTGSTCNKIGVYYPAFRNQGAKCSSPVGRQVYNRTVLTVYNSHSAINTLSLSSVLRCICLSSSKLLFQTSIFSCLQSQPHQLWDEDKVLETPQTSGTLPCGLWH